MPGHMLVVGKMHLHVLCRAPYWMSGRVECSQASSFMLADDEPSFACWLGSVVTLPVMYGMRNVPCRGRSVETENRSGAYAGGGGAGHDGGLCSIGADGASGTAS